VGGGCGIFQSELGSSGVRFSSNCLLWGWKSNPL